MAVWLSLRIINPTNWGTEKRIATDQLSQESVITVAGLAT